MEQLEVSTRSWHRVSTRLSVERSYQCSVPMARHSSLISSAV